MAAASALITQIQACRLCAEDFARTTTAHEPRPVTWFHPAAKVLIVGQAPGLKVHETGKPFSDRSGDRLREWLGLAPDEFYDRQKVAIVPMAFCFPGYDAKGSDLPPPPRCACTWRQRTMSEMANIRLTVVVGAYAQAWHLGETTRKMGVTETVRSWRKYAPQSFPLPHPSWRNNAFLRRNPWFEAELLPALRTQIRPVLGKD